MSAFEWASIAVNVFVLGVAAWIVRTQLAATQSELKRLIECLHKLELKLSSCVTWSELDRLCGIEKARVDELDRRVDDHETRIRLQEVKG